MTGGVTLSVRQISSYPLTGAAGPGDLLLMQPGGLGNPYATVDAATLVATALEEAGGPLAVGVSLPAGAENEQIFTGSVVLPMSSAVSWNCYGGPSSTLSWEGGSAATFGVVPGGFAWAFGSGVAGGEVGFSYPMFLSGAGALALTNGTLTVARDPGSALEVATMGWVGNSTVASFNGRKGVVQLTSADIYNALCLDSCIATENWVTAAIQAGNQHLLANHPFVFGWNGRTGAVYLTLADISCVFFQPGQQPITQTPPLTSNDYSIPNTAWVVEYIANEFAGGGSTLATQAWVLANTVNSFNGRQGVVTLTSSDVFDVGAAPLNSPAFSGIPTAPTAAVGQATGQIATTAFVQQAITNNTAGVSTWNTRTGDVVLENADVVAAGGLTNPSAVMTGNPTCPTQPPGTNLPLIANCEFVQAAIAAGTVTSFNTRTGAVTLTLADVTGVGGAPLVSPAFSSVPTAPTAAPGTNTVQLATTAFVTAAVTAAGGVSSFNSRTGAVDLIANDISAAGGLVNPSVNLTGSPTATTATAGDNSTRIATTAFVTTALSAGAVSSFNTRTGAVTLQAADITNAGGALLASPAFTGAPTAPTAAPATNNTQIATTAYVTAAILADTTGVTSFNTRTGAVSLLLADITGAGGAPLASPSFTGTPLGPTATPGTSTTQLATTAFVAAAIAASGVTSFNARTGAVTLIANDISAASGALLASPIFTGVPAAPTAAPGTNTTQLATTAFVAAAIAAGGPYVPLAGNVTMTGPLGASGFFAPFNSGIAFNQTFTGAVAATGQSSNIGVGGGGLNIASYPSAAAGATPANQTILGIGAGTGSFNFLANPGGTGALTLDLSSNVSALIQFPTSSQIVSTSGYFAIGLSGAWNAANAWRIQWNRANGQLVYYNGSSAVLLQMDGVGNMTIGGTLTQGSDARTKSNIAAWVPGLSIVKQLLPKSFTYTADPLSAPHLGFVAQDVQPVLPEAVGGSEEDGYGLDTTPIVAVLVNAVQQLLSRIEALESAAGIIPDAAEVA